MVTCIAMLPSEVNKMLNELNEIRIELSFGIMSSRKSSILLILQCLKQSFLTIFSFFSILYLACFRINSGGCKVKQLDKLIYFILLLRWVLVVYKNIAKLKRKIVFLNINW